MSRFSVDNVLKFQEQVRKQFERLPYNIDQKWSQAVQLGWYPTSYMPFNLPNKLLSTPEALDLRMLEAFESSYSEAKEYLLSHSRDRTHIIEVAIQLHEKQNFIASVPLFLSQIDGIFEELLGQSAFTRRAQNLDKVGRKLDNIFEADSMKRAIFGQFCKESPYSASSDSDSEEDKAKAPNRNGILHGDYRHLDYGTYINSCKSICLLSSVIWLMSSYEEEQTYNIFKSDLQRLAPSLQAGLVSMS